MIRQKREGGVLARRWSLRTSIALLLMATTVSTFLLLAAALLVYRLPAIAENSRENALHQSGELANLIEYYLSGIESRLKPGVPLTANAAPAAAALELDALVGDDGAIEALYVVDAQGAILALGLPASMRHRRADLQIGDFSSNRLFRNAREAGRSMWSDKYLSAMSGSFVIGLALPVGEKTVIAEISPQAILETIRTIALRYDHPVLVVDSRGEWIADNAPDGERRLQNWAGLPGVMRALQGEKSDDTSLLFGAPHHTGHARSQLLGWHFIIGIPAGLANPDVRASLIFVTTGFLAALLVSLLIAPVWAVRVTRPLRALIARTHHLAAGNFSTLDRQPSRIREVFDLDNDLERMAAAIREREERIVQRTLELHSSEQELQKLNAELESRVASRTEALAGSNRELAATLEHLQQAQNELVRSEKQAALGRLVAGVAHELNTPIGNALMAATTFRDQLRELRRSSAAGNLKRSEFATFLDNSGTADDIIVRNLERSATLINSFKRVAVDQANDQRRQFLLDETVAETLMILQPSLKRTPYRIEAKIPKDVAFDSFPGALEQVLANLIHNAVIHAFEGRDHGTIVIDAERVDAQHVRLRVCDDGIGIASDIQKRIFDPFFTTKFGRGGSGLGLHICQNAVSAILGGSIAVDSNPGAGSCFVLHLPLVAPKAAESAENSAPAA